MNKLTKKWITNSCRTVIILNCDKTEKDILVRDSSWVSSYSSDATRYVEDLQEIRYCCIAEVSVGMVGNYSA